MNPFDFKIKYKNGVYNIHADALSRLNYANELVSIGGKSDNIIVSMVEKEAEDEEFKNKRRHSSYSCKLFKNRKTVSLSKESERVGYGRRKKPLLRKITYPKAKCSNKDS